MNTSTPQSYNVMLQSLLFNITPALPAGAGGTREPVGEPEHIPEITFITREIAEEDDVEPPEDYNGSPEDYRNNLNGYIQDGIEYHQLYGLIPDDSPSSNNFIIESVEEILGHFSDRDSSEKIERIRLVSHGNDSFLFVPLFRNGSWNIGIQEDWLEAFQESDEEGIRFLISNDDPMIRNGLSTIISGIRAADDSLLEPFGIKDSGMPPSGDVELFFQLVNDYFQVENGTLVEATYHNPETSPDNTPEYTYELINSYQQGHLNKALDFLYEKVKSELTGTSVEDSDIELTEDHLKDFKDEVTSSNPVELGFMGPIRNLGANVLSDLETAMIASPRSEDDLRNAIVGHTNEPLFWGHTSGFIMVLELFYPDSLKLGPSDSIEITSQSDLSSVTDLESYFTICSDIFFMEKAPVSIDGTEVTDAQRNTLTVGLRAIATIIRDRIVNGSSGITAAELDTIRTNIEDFTIRETAITGGWKSYLEDRFPEMSVAVDSMNAGFRKKINDFRTLINSDSNIDIRGCLIGKSPEYLNDLRDFFGTAGSILDDDNRPNISAPEWYQSFPGGLLNDPNLNKIDDLIQNGIPENYIRNGYPPSDIPGSDVETSFSDWKELIDFDPHFTFIRKLFDGTTSRFDFATLEWNTWRSNGSTTGIPILSMEAERIDDLVDLNLGEVIERFRVIFDIPSGSAPDATKRTQLDSLQPHLVTFKNLKDTVDSAGSPNSEQLTDFFNDVSTLADNITGISGMPAPSSPPLVPSSEPSPLELSDIETYISDVKTYIDDYLYGTCGTFFTAVFDPGSGNGALQHSNAENRYYLNIGLPLLVQSSVESSHPPFHTICTIMSASSSSQRDSQIANALRSWMKIQWTGSSAQASEMNSTIDNVSIENEIRAASRVSKLTDKDPSEDGAEAEINPMPKFEDYIVKRPII